MDPTAPSLAPVNQIFTQSTQAVVKRTTQDSVRKESTMMILIHHGADQVRILIHGSKC